MTLPSFVAPMAYDSYTRASSLGEFARILSQSMNTDFIEWHFLTYSGGMVHIGLGRDVATDDFAGR